MKNKYIHNTSVHNTKAAEKIVPFIMEIFNPFSIVDIGCGTGTWLKVFLDKGINDILGVEGFHLDKNKLLISKEALLLHDLEKPLNINRKFDLAISLEVAEHLTPKVAEEFIKNITSLSDVILFSAAIPYQGGQNHINEQWLNYWITEFAKFNYLPFDILRPVFWNDNDVEFWYKQNMLLFLNKSSKKVSKLGDMKSFHSMNIVHPELYEVKSAFLRRVQSGRTGVKPALKILAKSFLTSFKQIKFLDVLKLNF